ncbi:MAG: hypothetical protein HQM08_04130 [Candidatus Riflebacteria bacterium]|nr:hypothetical protein [Candidatus Riflebacteria bacterium]
MKKSQRWTRTLLLAFLSAAYLVLFLRVLFPVYDEGIIVCGAKRIVEGEIPYRDFFECIAPGSFYLLAGWFKLLGISFKTVRISLLLTGILSVILIDTISRKLFSSLPINEDNENNLKKKDFQKINSELQIFDFNYLPALYALIFGIPFWVCASHHWDSNLFTFLTTFLFLRAIESGKSVHFFLVGITTALTGAFMQQKGPILLHSELFVLVIIWFRSKQNMRKNLISVASLFGGFALVGIFIGVYFFLNNGLSDLIFNLVEFPITNYNHLNKVPYGFAFWEFLVPFWLDIASILFPTPLAEMFTGIIISPLIFLSALPLLCLLLIFINYRYAKSGTLTNWNFLACLILGAELWASEMQRRDYFHILFAAPLLFTAICYLLSSLREVFPKSLKAIKIFLISSALLCGFFNALPAFSVTHKVNSRQGIIRTSKVEPILDFLLKNCKENEEVFIYPYSPMLYFLGNVKNPTRYSVLTYGFHTDEQINEAISTLERKKAHYILFNSSMDATWLKGTFLNYTPPPKEKQLIERFIEREYKLQSRCGDYRILVHR